MSTVVAKNIAVQNSAGTASANISFDGTKLVGSAPFDGFGVGQTWQNVTASRSSNVTYTNSTGKPIKVNISTYNNVSANAYFYINDVIVQTVSYSTANVSIGEMVPSGATYKYYNSNGTPVVTTWFELR